MKEPALVIMAAGMGSRYGGLKQIDPIDDRGHVIIDYSLYDAKRAGFKKVIFITKEADEKSFKEIIADRMKDHFDVEIVLQDVANIPGGYTVPEGRIKPWGTGHALYCCMDVVDGPVAVINADDYYGIHAYQSIYTYLTTHEDGDKASYAMVGYLLGNTVTDNGHVARGICDITNGMLRSITERTRIEKRSADIAYTEDEGATWHTLPEDTIVSMNMWGFSKRIMQEVKEQFPVFLNESLISNPLKGEFYLPFAVDTAIRENRANVEVLTSTDKWYGVTYKEDKPNVTNALLAMRQEGLYPEDLWG